MSGIQERMTLAQYRTYLQKKKVPRHLPGEMNSTEALRASFLENGRRAGTVKDWAFEPIKIRLADTTFYSPDFFSMDWEGARQFEEVKAAWKVDHNPLIYSPHWTDDSRVKFKVCRERLLKLFGIPLVAVWFHPFHRTWECEP